MDFLDTHEAFLCFLPEINSRDRLLQVEGIIMAKNCGVQCFQTEQNTEIQNSLRILKNCLYKFLRSLFFVSLFVIPINIPLDSFRLKEQLWPLFVKDMRVS